MDMTFVSEFVAYDFYNNYAIEKGFILRLPKTMSSKGPFKEVRRRRMVCSRERKCNTPSVRNYPAFCVWSKSNFSNFDQIYW
jgi:hypothetical protein